MIHKIPFTNERFLEETRSDFFGELLKLYTDLGDLDRVKEKISELFAEPNIKQSDIEFDYEPLLLGKDKDEEQDFAIENIKRIHKSLGILTPSQAAMEKIWVALLNTYYLDYHLHVIRGLQGRKDVGRDIYNRTFLSGQGESDKRHQLMNNLSVLWWIGHYTYDKDAANPYHLTEFYASTPYRGNTIAFFSSNIHSNRTVSLGVLNGIKQLVEGRVIALDRFAYTEANKIINIIAGVKLIDMLTREEIAAIIVNDLPKSALVTKI